MDCNKPTKDLQDFPLPFKSQGGFSLMEVILAAALMGTISLMTVTMMGAMGDESKRLIQKNRLSSEMLIYFGALRNIYRGNLSQNFADSTSGMLTPWRHFISLVEGGDRISFNIDLKQRIEDVTGIRKGSVDNYCVSINHPMANRLPSYTALSSSLQNSISSGKFSHLGAHASQWSFLPASPPNPERFCHISRLFPQNCPSNSTVATRVSKAIAPTRIVDFPATYGGKDSINPGDSISVNASYVPFAAVTCIADIAQSSQVFVFMAFLNPHIKLTGASVRDLPTASQYRHFRWNGRSITIDNFSSFTDNVAYMFNE
jgi:hypothetical protein